jgi:hypothetical protein
VIIVCDFTGEDWDQETPMIEGHGGSVISLGALARAIEEARPLERSAQCTLCLRTVEPPAHAWSHPDPPPSANAEALICWDCMQQADRAFAKDPDTDWERKIPPDKNWR